MKFGPPCAPPAAWLALIARKPRLAMRSYEPGPAPAGARTSGILYRVQEAVNASIRYQAEARDVWGVLAWRKIWGLTGRRWIRVGDCDDYAVAKLERLLGLGFGGSMRLVMCRYGSIGHLVLTCTTTETTLILDNRQAGIWPWDAVQFSRYRWITASVPGRLRWARIIEPETLEDLARKVT
jgi:predicted transglutaminase-like cysteine proteinase